jgi:hypothetical protein
MHKVSSGPHTSLRGSGSCLCNPKGYGEHLVVSLATHLAQVEGLTWRARGLVSIKTTSSVDCSWAISVVHTACENGLCCMLKHPTLSHSLALPSLGGGEVGLVALAPSCVMTSLRNQVIQTVCKQALHAHSTIVSHFEECQASNLIYFGAGTTH